MRTAFYDSRDIFTSLSDMEVFYAASGEQEEEIQEGSAVACHVVYAAGVRVYAQLLPSEVAVSFADLREIRSLLALKQKVTAPEQEDLSPLVG